MKYEEGGKNVRMTKKKTSYILFQPAPTKISRENVVLIFIHFQISQMENPNPT